MKTVAFHTLGCKVNTYDTEAMMELFEKADYEIVHFENKSDVYIINTCTVTSMGDKKSRQMIRKAKRKNPDAVVAVTGCYAQTSAKELEKIPEVDIIVGNQDRNSIVSLVEKLKESGKKISIVQDIMHTKEYEELKITKVKDRTRAFIKIQEGCNNFCSYCIIPYARGPVRSRTVENILDEARNIAEQGYKEIVVTGINVSSYGKELVGTSLIHLLESLNRVKGIERIRLGSLEPMLIDEDFVYGLKGIDKLCDHFHLSLQSGSDEVLKRMNRKYDKLTFEKIVRGIRESFPQASITTDIMVGFPSEGEEEFDESYEFIKKIGFSKLHVFKYSRRKGTPAAKMDNQIPEPIKEKRSKKVIELSNLLEEEYAKKFIGESKVVLFEQRSKEDYNIYQGHTTNYLLVQAYSQEDLIGKLISVELTAVKLNYMEGRIK